VAGLPAQMMTTLRRRQGGSKSGLIRRLARVRVRRK
jgi:hypothetical protein